MINDSLTICRFTYSVSQRILWQDCLLDIPGYMNVSEMFLCVDIKNILLFVFIMKILTINGSIKEI